MTALENAHRTESDALPLAPGRRIGDFLVTRVVGQGGFGIVYEAQDLTLQRRVAIKEYMPAQLAARLDEAQVHPASSRHAKTFELGRRSFLAEARLLAQFRHPGLLEVLHFWEQNGTAYMVMPFYEGRTLEQVLANGPAVVNETWLKALLHPVLDALEHMHAADCYHRDVSADNILIRDGGKAMLLDLGAARRVIGDSERALTVMLKPGYAPIEQYADDPACRQGPWTDIYAVAAVLYFAVTMRMPPASASRVMHDSLPALAQLKPEGYSQKFLEAIDRGLSIRPEQRPRTIGEFRSMLFDATQEKALASARPSGGEKPHPAGASSKGDAAVPVARARNKALAALAVAALAVAALAFFAWPTEAPIAASTSPAFDAASSTLPQGRTPATEASDASVARPLDPAALDESVSAARAGADAMSAPGAVATTRGDASPASTDAAPAAADREARSDARAQPAEPAAVPTGSIRLAVSPWGEVIVDGVSRGVTPPLKQFAVRAGRHRVEIRNPGGPSWTKEIVVRAGEPTVVTHRFP